MDPPRVVLDTNVVVSALRSQLGASYKLLSLLGSGRFTTCVSVPLVLEYEAAGKRVARACGLTHADIDDVIDFLCSVSDRRAIHFLWRPVLNDIADDMVLEIAFEAEAKYIVTYNQRDFLKCSEFGLTAVTPQQLLQIIGEIL